MPPKSRVRVPFEREHNIHATKYACNSFARARLCNGTRCPLPHTSASLSRHFLPELRALDELREDVVASLRKQPMAPMVDSHQAWWFLDCKATSGHRASFHRIGTTAVDPPAQLAQLCQSLAQPARTSQPRGVARSDPSSNRPLSQGAAAATVSVRGGGARRQQAPRGTREICGSQRKTGKDARRRKRSGCSAFAGRSPETPRDFLWRAMHGILSNRVT